MRGKKAKALKGLAKLASSEGENIKYLAMPRAPSPKTLRTRMALQANLGNEEMTKEDIEIITSKITQRVLDPKCIRGFYKKLKRLASVAG